MDDEKLAEVKEIFGHFDKDGNGTFEPNELLKLLRALGEEPTADDLAMALEALDLNHNGHIEFSEFCDWWLDR